MKRFVICYLLFVICPISAYAEIGHDMEDPMFFESSKDIVSRTSVEFGDKVLRASERISYGLNGFFSLSADIKYQESFDNSDDGFGDIGLMATYRVSGDNNIKTDIFAGLDFTGAASVPNFSDTVYAAGVRMGRQWAQWTLSGTLQSSWIFDSERGMAYIDFMPEIYVRLNENWRTGMLFNLRRATEPDFNQEWLGAKVLRQFGRTQYVGLVNYEFENSEFVFGAKINILF